MDRKLNGVMTDPRPFLPHEAQDVFQDDAQGDFLLPLCMPTSESLVGEDLAILVLATVEGQRIGMPIGVEALEGLHDMVGEALRMLRASEGGSVQ